MYLVVFEINDELTGPTGQDPFEPLCLSALDQPEIVDEFIERWTRPIRAI
jgi:hypothetical protein